MLSEFRSCRLDVVLIPSRDDDCAMRGGMIRAVQERNADWYREFCGEYESHRKYRGRKFKTKIKRSLTEQGLEDLIAGRCATIYAERLEGFIKRMIVSERSERRVRRAA